MCERVWECKCVGVSVCGSVCVWECKCVECVCVTLKPQKPVKLERVPGAVLTHARSYFNWHSGIPEGSIDSNRSGIPEGSIDSIGDPLGLDRSIDRSTRIDRSGIP